MADASEMSKSAKRRANKKANESAKEAEPVAPPAPVPAAKSKAAASAPVGAGYAEPKAKAKAKADPKAQPKAEAKAQPKAEAKAEPKAKAKGKAEPKAEPKAAVAPKAEPKAEPKASAKSEAKKAKAKAKAEPVEEEKPKKVEIVQPISIDDGTGGDWDVAASVSKKQQRRQERITEEKTQAKQAAVFGTTGNKHVPGFAPVVGGTIPGMGPVAGSSSAAVSQSVSATPKNPDAKEDEKPKVQSSTAQIKVPEDKIGICIGPKGATIKLIQEKTGVTGIDTSGEAFTITGPDAAVAQAEKAIQDLITKGYTNLQYDDFEEESVMVWSNTFPDLIGKKGAVIMAIKKELKCEISIPKTGPAGRKWKVTIAGAKENCARAKQVIENIVMYYHDEITHPGEVHEEMEIPAWSYAWIIGSKGSELRHIQNNFRVRVYIPRDGISENPNVVVVGQKDDVPRAKVYIEKLLNASEEKVGGRAKGEKADDHWGKEEPDEPWMQQYMYKR